MGGTSVAAGTFLTARIAVVASDCGQKLPVDILAEESEAPTAALRRAPGQGPPID